MGQDINEILESHYLKYKKRTPLMQFSSRGITSIVEKLLDIPGIDVNMQDSDGNTALMLGIYLLNPDTINMLLERPDIDVAVEPFDHK